MLLFFLLYRSSRNIYTSQDAVLLDSFGFNVNGTYNVKFSNLDIPNLYYTLLSKKEFPIDLLLSASASKFCKGTPPIPKISILIPISDNFTFNGTIEEKNIYTPLVYNCNNDGMKLDLVQIFRNPDSFLDNRWISGDWSQFSLGTFLCIVFLFWIVNWFCHFRTNVKIHYFLTTTLILGISYHISFFLELVKLNKVDESILNTSIRQFLSFCYNAFMYITMLLSIKGWCVYKQHLTMKDMFLSFIYVFLFTACNCVMTFTSLGKYQTIVYLVNMFSLMLLVREFIISLKNSYIHFVAHLYVIANAGVSPTTTPIYAKYRMYYILRFTVIVCCFYIIFRMITGFFSNPFLWIDQLIFDLMQIVMNIILCLTFKLSKSEQDDQYLMLSEDEYEQTTPEELQLTDIKEIKMSDLKSKTGIAWERGIKLPNAPIIKDTAQRYDTSRLSASKIKEMMQQEIHEEIIEDSSAGYYSLDSYSI